MRKVVTVHQCDVCGRQFLWHSDAWAKTVFFGHADEANDEVDFVVCSLHCRGMFNTVIRAWASHYVRILGLSCRFRFDEPAHEEELFTIMGRIE